MTCMKCFEEFGKPNFSGSVEFRNDGRYVLKCAKGHETITILQQQKFELLFDIGANAILDGYYREAVSSFTSSLERFYEFSIRVFLEKTSGSDELFKACWKKVSNQSERQLGAFIFLWSTFFGETPELLSDRQVSFRNSVIHKGRIPSKREAIIYGNDILSVLYPKMLAIKEKYPEEVQKVVFYHIRDCKSKQDQSKTVSTYSIQTIVSLSFNGKKNSKIVLEDQLDELIQRRRIFQKDWADISK